ncbi:ribbon-helix-helix domain-containing protein [Paenibacillus sp. YIM B09110]|uniref:ribbon-helix-helix domain-containing protein n=1 Tax=Paenibacillus sp. YIM B09110 TaxID=3126102 RepID=UPI00301E22FA
MPAKKIKLGIPEHEGQLSIMFSQGGPRTGAGRKGIGETRKISLTLPSSAWEQIESQCEKDGRSRSEVLRNMIEAYLSDQQTGEQ